MEQHSTRNRILVVKTGEQARLLMNFAYQRVLEPTIQAEASAGEVARAAEISVKQAHHRLTRLCGAGLVEVTSERPRAGRPIKLYRAIAAQYRIPFDLTGADDLRDLFRAVHQPFVDAYLTHMAVRGQETNQGLVLSMDDQGQLCMHYGPRVLQEERYGAIGVNGELTLSPSTLAELEGRLRDLYQWVMERDQAERHLPESRSTLLALLFTPGQLPER